MPLSRFGAFVGHLSDTRLRIWLSVGISTVLFGLFDLGIDRIMSAFEIEHDLHVVLQAALVGIGGGVAILLLLSTNRSRRHLVTDELRRVAELNHTIRNSLEIIVMAHHFADDAHKAIIIESTNRIDEKLKELFPVLSMERRKTMRHTGRFLSPSIMS